MNTICKMTKKISMFFLTLATAAIMVGCGQANGNKQTNANNDIQPEQTVEQEVVESSVVEVPTVVEESTVESEVVEKTKEEPDTSNLSNEEWVQSLNVETATFLIFNEDTGERKVLENGEHYKMLETDILALTMPQSANWELKGYSPITLMKNKEVKYMSLLLHLDSDEIGEDTEIKVDFKDSNGNDVTITTYLSK